MRADTNESNSSPSPRFHFVGGKGGVGKTTCAAAFAVGAAASGARVLVASTDPAPSLGDAFKQPLGAEPRKIPIGRRVLWGVEIDAPPALERWITERRTLLERIALEGTWLDRDDVTRLLGLSLPGIDEVAALLEIARLSRTGPYDLVVVDTAPTGHTLRMLSMPETLFAIARVFDTMREKHRVMVQALRGTWSPEPEDELVYNIAAQAKDLAALLRDPARMRMSWVTLPEPMALAETSDAFAALRAREIPVSELIVNRLTPAPASRCGHCRARRAFEIRTLRDVSVDVPIRTVLDREVEPRGMTALKQIGAQLKAGARPHFSEKTPKIEVWHHRPHGAGAAAKIEDIVPATARVVLFGGKGGVGKTTCAAAAAIAMADKQPQKRILLISIDPAHSLGDVLRSPLSDDPISLSGAPGNLAVRELNAARVFEDVRRKYAAAIDQIFARLGAGKSFDAGHDRSIMHRLIDLAPPGLDELASVIEIMDSATSDDAKWDVVIIDTAPTGHALRLLETPSLIHDWTKALMAILLKYQPVAGVGELGSLLVRMSRGLGRLGELLSDAERASFIVVTRPAALPRAESVRLIERLGRLEVSVPTVIVNAVGRGTCVRCRTAAAAENKELAVLQRAVAGRPLVLAGKRIPGPAGVTQLRAWQRQAWLTT